MKLVYYSFLRLSFTFLCVFFEAHNENILVMKGGNRIDAYKGFSIVSQESDRNRGVTLLITSNKVINLKVIKVKRNRVINSRKV
jgi:hypothetical protein